MPLEGVPKKRFFALSILEDTSHHKSFDAGISLEHWIEQKKIVTEKNANGNDALAKKWKLIRLLKAPTKSSSFYLCKAKEKATER